MFTEDLIEVWLDYKRTVELDQDAPAPPPPREFELYYDVRLTSYAQLSVLR